MRTAVDIAPIRAEPQDDAEQVTQALRGEPIEAGERRDGWVHVTTAYGYPGWMREEHLEEGEGALPQPREGSTIEEARTYLGTVYEWGGLTERGIDCSGLVHMSYRRLGRIVPRDADQQEEAGIEVDDPQPGDLVTYGDPGKHADHIGFWLGNGRILHSTGRDDLGVVEEDEPESLRARRRKIIRL